MEQVRLLVGLCVEYIADNMDTFPASSLRTLPLELRNMLLDHLLQRMKLGEVDFSPLLGQEGVSPVIHEIDLASSPYEELNGPSADLLRHIGACAPKLKSLRMDNCRVLDDDRVKVMLDALPHLEALYLSGAMNVTDKAILSIKDRIGPQLKYLKIHTPNRLTTPALNQLLISAPQLRSFVMYSAASLVDDIIGVIADDCADLTTLKVRGCPKLTDKTIEYISKGTDGTAGLRKLQTLTLDAPNITGNNLELLVGSCPNLESLTLSIKEPSAFTQLSKLATLRNLNLISGREVGGEALKLILQGCGMLESLALRIDSDSQTIYETFSTVDHGLRKLCLIPSTKMSYINTCQIVNGCARLQKLDLHGVVTESLVIVLHHLSELRSLKLSFSEQSELEEEDDMSPEEKTDLATRIELRKKFDSGIISIASSSLQRLEVSGVLLPTNRTQEAILTAPAMRNIAQHSPKLKVIKLAQIEFDADAVLQEIANARLPLTKFQLYKSDSATDKGMQALVQACGLDLRHIPNLTEDSLDSIFRNCPVLRTLFITQTTQALAQAVSRRRRTQPMVNIY